MTRTNVLFTAARPLACGAGAMALGCALMLPAAANSVTGPMTVNNALSGFSLEGATTSAHGIGLKGISSDGTYGTGVYGVSTSGPGVLGTSSSVYAGIMGISTFPNGTGVQGRSQGDAVYGLSFNENGIFGATRTGATGPNTGFGGVVGLDNSVAGNNYGVAGQSSIATGTGTAGLGFDGATGVRAQSDSGPALTATATTTGPAVLASSVGGFGLYASSTSTGSPAVFGTGIDGLIGIGHQSNTLIRPATLRRMSDRLNSVNGVGVGGGGEIGLAGIAENYNYNGNPIATAAYLESDQDTEPGSYEIQAYCSYDPLSPPPSTCPGGSSYVQVMSLDNQGNLSLGGTLTTGLNKTILPSVTSRIQRVGYGTTAATPTLEDTGEAALSGGVASVSLDPAFADSIARSATYMVFLTPLGDTQGWLYVATRTPSGFVVREHGGAHSNVVFDYRIAARPAGAQSARLPLYVAPRSSNARPAQARNASPPLALPQARPKLAFGHALALK